MQLSKRLLACANFVRKGCLVCDVGSDHAYLACYLVLNKQVSGAIATDLNYKPLLRAKQTISTYQLDGCITLVQSDGLEKIGCEQADDIVIAGMGGQLIARILSDCPWHADKRKHYLLQPMSQISFLRHFLYLHGFEIVQEQAVYDNGHYYSVLCCRFSGIIKQLTPLESMVGSLPLNFDLFAYTTNQAVTAAYLTHQATRMQKVANGLAQSSNAEQQTAHYQSLAREILALLPLTNTSSQQSGEE